MNAAGDGFVNDFIPQRTSSFTTWFMVSPFDPNGATTIDAVVGLSNGPARAFTDLAAIVRFNPDGYIDARNGDTYMADVAFPYSAAQAGTNVFYDFELDVDVAFHRYTVLVWRDGTSPPIRIASNYAFRTEQADVPRLDTISREVDSSSGGTNVGDLSFWPDICDSALASTGWVARPFPAQSGSIVVEFDATPFGNTDDTVIGLSNGYPGAFADLAAIVRFNTAGIIDVRNGDSYAYDNEVSFQNGKTVHFRMTVDIANSVYSVYVKPGTADTPSTYTTLASGYAFRTEQAGVGSLDHIGAFLDTSDTTGSGADYCNPQIAY